MKYLLDQDLHIHTQLSPCSSNPEQNPDSILRYGEKYGLRDIVLTDHFWDETVPGCIGWQGYAHISKWLPLPQGKTTRLHLGCEADMNRANVLGLSRATADKLEFIAVAINHLHFQMKPEERYGVDWYAEQFLLRWKTVLDSDLPFHKMGLAHPTFRGIAGNMPDPRDHLDVLEAIPDAAWLDMFARTEKLGMGIELNAKNNEYSEDDFERVLRVFRLAAEAGCHFYGATDSHHPAHLAPRHENCLKLIDALGLTEDQKFRPFD